MNCNLLQQIQHQPKLNTTKKKKQKPFRFIMKDLFYGSKQVVIYMKRFFIRPFGLKFKYPHAHTHTHTADCRSWQSSVCFSIHDNTRLICQSLSGLYTSQTCILTTSKQKWINRPKKCVAGSNEFNNWAIDAFKFEKLNQYQ